MAIDWKEDNSNDIEHTVDGSGSAASLTATILDSTGTSVWSGPLEPTGTDDYYATTVHPDDPSEPIKRANGRYLLRIEGTYGGATLESEESFTPRVRRTS